MKLAINNFNLTEWALLEQLPGEIGTAKVQLTSFPLRHDSSLNFSFNHSRARTWSSRDARLIWESSHIHLGGCPVKSRAP